MSKIKSPGEDQGQKHVASAAENTKAHTAGVSPLKVVLFRIEYLEELQEIANGLAAAPVIEASTKDAAADFVRFLRSWAVFATAVHQSEDFCAELEAMLSAWNALLPRLASGEVRPEYVGGCLK